MEEQPIQLSSGLPESSEDARNKRQRPEGEEPAVESLVKKTKSEWSRELFLLKIQLRSGKLFQKTRKDDPSPKDEAFKELAKLGDQEDIFVVAQDVKVGLRAKQYWILDESELLSRIYNAKVFGRECNYYEILRGPVRLVLDLEYEKTFNPDRDMDEMCGHALRFVHAELAEIGIQATPDDWTVQDSSGPKKGSRHYELKASKAVFESLTDAVGPFMHKVGERIEQAIKDGDQGALLLRVAKDKGVTVSFVDLGIYGKDRLFRFVYNQKIGDPRVLKPLGDDDNVIQERITKRFREARVCVKQEQVEWAKANGCFIRNIERPIFKRPRGPTADGIPSARDYTSLHGPDTPYREALIYCYEQMCEKNPSAKLTKIEVKANGSVKLHYDKTKNCCWDPDYGKPHSNNNGYQVLEPNIGVLFWKCYSKNCTKPRFGSNEEVLPEPIRSRTIAEYFGTSKPKEEEPAPPQVPVIQVPSGTQGKPSITTVPIEELCAIHKTGGDQALADFLSKYSTEDLDLSPSERNRNPHEIFLFNWNLRQEVLKEFKELKQNPHTKGYIVDAIINRSKLLLPDPHRPGHLKPQDLVDVAIALTVILKSGMGTGKTRLLLSLIENHPDFKRILSIVPAQTLASSQVERLIEFGFKDYRECKKTDMDLSKHDRLVTQLESLICLKDLSVPYDLIVLDEIETLLSHFKSDTLKGRRKRTWEILKFLCLQAKVVLFMDADAGQRARWFAELTRPGKIVFITNTYHKEGMKLVVHKKWEKWLQSLYQALSEGKKIMIPTNFGQRKVDRLILLLKKDFADRRILAYHRNVDDVVKKDSAKCDAIWTNYDVVIFSPTISCGVDFQVTHFDCTFALAQSKSNTAREFMQQIGRARNNRTDDLHVFFDCRVSKNDDVVCPTPDTIMAKILKDQKEMDILGGDEMLGVHLDQNTARWIPDCPDYVNLYCMNAQEAFLSKYGFQREFLELARNKGYVVEYDEEEPMSNPLSVELAKIGKGYNIKKKKEVMEAPILSYRDFLEIRDRMRRGEKVSEDQPKLDKYNMMEAWGLEDVKDVELFPLWKKLSRFWNARRLTETVKDVYGNELNKNRKDREFTVESKLHTLQVNACKKMAAAWGFHNTIFENDGKLVGEMTPEKKWILDNIDDINTLFKTSYVRTGCHRSITSMVDGEPADKNYTLSQDLADVMDAVTFTSVVFRKYTGVGMYYYDENLNTDQPPIFKVFWERELRDDWVELMASRSLIKPSPTVPVSAIVERVRPRFRFGKSTGVWSWTYYCSSVPHTEPGLCIVDLITMFWMRIGRSKYGGKSERICEVQKEFEKFAEVELDLLFAPQFAKLMLKIEPGMQKDASKPRTLGQYYIFPEDPTEEEEHIDYSCLADPELSERLTVQRREDNRALGMVDFALVEHYERIETLVRDLGRKQFMPRWETLFPEIAKKLKFMFVLKTQGCTLLTETEEQQLRDYYNRENAKELEKTMQGMEKKIKSNVALSAEEEALLPDFEYRQEMFALMEACDD